MNNVVYLYNILIGKELCAADLIAIGLDPLFVDAARLVVEKRDYCLLLFQKAFNISYDHAQQLFRELRDFDVIGSAADNPRKIIGQKELDEILKSLMRKRIGVASKEDLDYSWVDEYGVAYSRDQKRLLKAPEDIKKYRCIDGTTILCDKAFHGTNLESIIVPEGVVIVGNSCFGFCKKLTSIELPRSLQEIGYCAFQYCSHLASIVIPEGVKKVGHNLFAHSNNLSSITVDTGNPFFDSRSNCNAIIDTRSDTLCIACSATFIPEGIRIIGDGSFNCCEELQSISIPGSIDEIGFQAFCGCNKLKTVVLEEGVRVIGYYAFMDVYSLKHITLPKSLKTICDGAFEGCDIDSLILPEGVEMICGNPFKGNNLQHISVSENNKHYDSRGNCNAILQSQTNILITGSCSTIIPPSTKMVGESAFEGCKGLNFLEIPEGVTKIGFRAFASCENYGYPVTKESLFYDWFKDDEDEGLTSIVIPNSIEHAFGFVFGSPSSKLKIVIPKGTRKKYERIFHQLYKDQLVEQ